MEVFRNAEDSENIVNNNKIVIGIFIRNKCINMNFEKMYSELVKIVAEKNGVVVKTNIKPKKKDKKDVVQHGTVPTSN